MPALPADAVRSVSIGAVEFGIDALGRDELRVSLGCVPSVGISVPAPVLTGHQPRLNPATGTTGRPRRGESQRLHQHGSVRKSPPAAGRMGDAAVSGDGQKPLGLRAVGPGGCIDRVRHHARLNAVFAGRGEDARLAELAGECGCCGPWRGGHDLLQPRTQVGHQQTSGGRQTERGDEQRRGRDLAVPDHLRTVVQARPDPACGMIAIDISAFESGQLSTPVHHAASERASLAMVVFEGGGGHRGWSAPAVPVEQVTALVNAPAIVFSPTN